MVVVFAVLVDSEVAGFEVHLLAAVHVVLVEVNLSDLEKGEDLERVGLTSDWPYGMCPKLA